VTIAAAVKDLLGVGGDARRAVRRCARHEGLTLPPAPLRRCTVEFKHDAYFAASARREARRLIERCGLTAASRVLDIGCGPGRLPLGLIAELGAVRRYEGVDVDRHAIAWCRRWITPEHDVFRFTHLDVRNERYNAGGEIRLDERFRFDFDDGGFDVIYLYSVFTHMVAAEIGIYLAELRRLLAPRGRVFLTAYIEDGVPDVSVNPPGYRQASITPLHRVRLSRRYFERLVARHALAVARLDHAAEHDGQSGIYLAHRPERAP
jgi:SAM-dependent methyltransferase